MSKKTPLTLQPASSLLFSIKKNQIEPGEILSELKERVNQIDSKVKAYINLYSDAAHERFLKNSKETKGKLCGLPIAIKDNICVANEETTCASKILKGFRPPYHATVIERLLNEGAVPFGRTNMDEFAFGSSCETSCYGPTFNPWDLTRVPGGSSGGSAAAVAAGEAILALGSDTGGSIRQPASFCGVVGLKPTYGRVSRFGLVAFASSLDQIGPITKTVRDSALLLSVIAGFDPMDSTSLNLPVPDYESPLGDSIKGIRLGIPKEYFTNGLNEEVKSNLQQAIHALERMGAQCEEVSLPHTPYAVSAYYLIAPSEASSNLARFDGVRYGFRANTDGILKMYEKTRGQGFGAEAKRRIILGTFALSSGYYDAYYLKALKVRAKISEDFEKVFQKFDAILTPTSPTTAFKLGERLSDPLTMYLSDIYTISVNLAGLPSISIPAGFSKDHLPIGLQIIGKPFDEGSILKIAYAFEQSFDYHQQTPENL